MKLCPELAEYLKNAEKTAHRFAPEGRVPSFKVGGAWGKYDVSAKVIEGKGNVLVDMVENLLKKQTSIQELNIGFGIR